MTAPRARVPSAGALVTLAVYAFLYAPLIVLVLFSFNQARLGARWEGFTLEWYAMALRDQRVLAALRNSVVIALATTVLATGAGTAAALAFHRLRVRTQGAWDALVVVPLVLPEIVLAASLVLLFAAMGMRLGFVTVVLAHVAFSLSYAVVVVRARLAGFDRSLEEAAMDLGASPWRTLRHVTLPHIAPGILAAALLVFSVSIDDYVVTSFVAGVGATTLPLHIYSMVRSGLSPEINAISTVLLTATVLLLFAAWRLEQGRRPRQVAVPVALGLSLLGAPFLLAPGSVTGGQGQLNVYIWSNYIAPETVRRFEERHHVRVNVDVYDSNEALIAKMQSGNVDYDVVCPSTYTVQSLIAQGLLRELDFSALPHLTNVDARFLDRPHDPHNRYSVPYFWGTTGIAYRKSKVGNVDSWGALWDARYRGRILMLDDARETFGAALKRNGLSVNTTDPGPLGVAQRALIAQRPLVRAYNSSNFEDVLLSGDVWLAQGWNGQFARAIAQDADIRYVIPREGSFLFLDSLAIPRGAPHPELAHAFLDFVMEAEVAAEICRTMQYSSPNRAALALLPAAIRDNPAIFPSAEVVARTEIIEDIGDATVLYDRLWTEVKTSR